MGNLRVRTMAVLLGLSVTACGNKSSTSGGGSGPSGTSGSGNATAEQACVDTINMYRATLSLPPYARWTDAEACADGQALKDGNAMSAHSAFGTCQENAQDECPGWPGPPETMITGCLKMMWAEGPGPFNGHGHYINMSSTQYTKVACGFHVFPDGSVWATQDFR